MLLATTWYVSNGGLDTNAGTQVAPFQTIAHAMATVASGDTVMVSSGTYHESVTVPGNRSNINLTGYGPTKPILEGDGTRGTGFYSTSGGNRVDGFEIAHYTSVGINMYYGNSNSYIQNNRVHHIGKAGLLTTTGIKLAYGGGMHIQNNEVCSVGPGGESMGVWLLNTHDARVEGNTIYLCRKEGVRDYYGLNTVISGNRSFLNWVGIALNEGTGALVTSNYLYDNAIGFNPKHVSDSSTLSYWHSNGYPTLTPQWSRFWHNTTYRNSQCAVSIAMNAPNADYIDIRDNLFSYSGSHQLHDFPSARGTNIIVDSNIYHRDTLPARVYIEGWNDPPVSVYTDLPSLRAALGWETNGIEADPQLIDPGAGNLDYRSTSVAAAGGVTLSDALGNQMGARGLAAATVTWTPYPMTAINANQSDSWWKARIGRSADWQFNSYWMADDATNRWVSYDFGQPETFNCLVMDVLTHNDPRNVKQYEFLVSDDNVTWTSILTGTNPDSEGSSYKYELAAPVTKRYLKFNMVNSFGGSPFVIADLRAGLLKSETFALTGISLGPGGAYSIAATSANSLVVHVTAGTVNFADDVGTQGWQVSLDVSAGATAVLLSDQTLSGLTIAGSGTVDLGSNQVSLSYTGSSPASLIQSYLASGSAGGNWNGTGICSSAAASTEAGAVGWADDGAQVVVKCTYYGDASFDGQVGNDDYSLIDAGYLSHLTGWQFGDFTYDGTVTSDDYYLMDFGYLLHSGLLPTVLDDADTACAPTTLTGLTSDQSVNPSGLDGTASDTAMRYGAYAGTTKPVLVFQLPDLPAGATLAAANLSFLYSRTTYEQTVNGDLYGLTARNSPAVLASDYSAPGTLIQQNILVADLASYGARTAGTSDGSGGGDEALISYLNAQLAATASQRAAGQTFYVFLRIDPQSAQTSYHPYFITTANATSNQPTLTYQQARITYLGNWTAVTGDANRYNGTSHCSNAAGASASVNFTGTGLTWNGELGPDRGKADVYVDGALSSTVDMYASSYQWQSTIWRVTGLSSGGHTVRIVVRSDKNPASSGYYTDLDQFLLV